MVIVTTDSFKQQLGGLKALIDSQDFPSYRQEAKIPVVILRRHNRIFAERAKIEIKCSNLLRRQITRSHCM